MTKKEKKIRDWLYEHPEVTQSNVKIAKLICLLDDGVKLMADKPIEKKLDMVFDAGFSIYKTKNKKS